MCGRECGVVISVGIADFRDIGCVREVEEINKLLWFHGVVVARSTTADSARGPATQRMTRNSGGALAGASSMMLRRRKRRGPAEGPVS